MKGVLRLAIQLNEEKPKVTKVNDRRKTNREHGGFRLPHVTEENDSLLGSGCNNINLIVHPENGWQPNREMESCPYSVKQAVA